MVDLGYEKSPRTTGQVAVSCPRLSKGIGIYNTDSSFTASSLMHVCLCMCDHFQERDGRVIGETCCAPQRINETLRL